MPDVHFQLRTILCSCLLRSTSLLFFHIHCIDLFDNSFPPFFKTESLLLALSINPATMAKFTLVTPRYRARGAVMVPFKLVVRLEYRAIEKHDPLCFHRLFQQTLALSTRHMLNGVWRRFSLSQFCSHRSFYHHYLLQLPRVVRPKRNWRKVCKLKARSGASLFNLYSLNEIRSSLLSAMQTNVWVM